MTDRELLELAAKAAGYNLFLAWTDFGHFDGYRIGSLSGDVWNALDDDGDALRLAVKLNIMINPDDVLARAVARDGAHYAVEESNGQSLLEAARRAIVRAAAGIGKEMS